MHFDNPAASSELAHILGVLIPLSAVVLGIGMSIVAIALRFRRQSRLAELIHAERMAAIEKGIEPPPLPTELLDTGTRSRVRTTTDFLRRGLFLLFVGIAITIALLVTSRHTERAVWGLVPTAAGAAYLLLYRLEVRRIQSRGASPTDRSADTPRA